MPVNNERDLEGIGGGQPGAAPDFPPPSSPGTLAGVAVGASSAAGTLAGIGFLLGLSGAVSGAVGIFVGIGSIAGTAQSTSLASGRLLLPGDLAGAAAARGGAAGSLTGVGSLAGTASAFSAATGRFVAIDLAGAAHSISSATGLPIGLGALSGAAVANSAAFGSFFSSLDATPRYVLIVPPVSYVLIIPRIGASEVADFPSIIATVQRQTVTLDFGQFLPEDVYLVGAPTFTIEVYSGADNNPNSRLDGSAQIGTVPISQNGTGVANAALLQRLQNLLGNVIYRLIVSCDRSDGDSVAFVAHVTGQAPD